MPMLKLINNNNETPEGYGNHYENMDHKEILEMLKDVCSKGYLIDLSIRDDKYMAYVIPDKGY